MRWVVISVLCMLIATALLIGLYYYESHRIDYSTIKYIKSQMKGKYTYSDLANDIGVNSEDDLGYEVKDRYHLVLYYGEQVINITPTCFKTPEFFEKLKEIGVTVEWRVRDDGEVGYKLEYFGDPIQKWVDVSMLPIPVRVC